MNLWFATVDITCWQLDFTKLKDAMCKNLPAFVYSKRIGGSVAVSMLLAVMLATQLALLRLSPDWELTEGVPR